LPANDEKLGQVRAALIAELRLPDQDRVSFEIDIFTRRQALPIPARQSGT
jgi:hypothetical protein